MDWIDGSVSLEEINRIIDLNVKKAQQKQRETEKAAIAINSMNQMICDQEAIEDFLTEWERTQPSTSARAKMAVSSQRSNSSYEEAFDKFINEWEADKHSQPTQEPLETSQSSATSRYSTLTQFSVQSVEKIMIPEEFEDSIMIYDEDTDDWILRPLNKTQRSPMRKEEEEDWTEPDPLGFDIELESTIYSENMSEEYSQQYQ